MLQTSPPSTPGSGLPRPPPPTAPAPPTTTNTSNHNAPPHAHHPDFQRLEAKLDHLTATVARLLTANATLSDQNLALSQEPADCFLSLARAAHPQDFNTFTALISSPTFAQAAARLGLKPSTVSSRFYSWGASSDPSLQALYQRVRTAKTRRRHKQVQLPNQDSNAPANPALLNELADKPSLSTSADYPAVLREVRHMLAPQSPGTGPQKIARALALIDSELGQAPS